MTLNKAIKCENNIITIDGPAGSGKSTIAKILAKELNLNYVDTGAILERDHAEQAGLGFLGKSTMLIHPRRGSFFFLGEIITDAELSTDEPPGMPGCGSCSRCLSACPTGALVAPYVLDARRCVSYLTIEHKGIVPVDLRPLMGNWVYGCDVCQQACPWQRFACPTSLKLFAQVVAMTGAGGVNNAGGPANATLTLYVATYRAAFLNYDMGIGSAMGYFMSVIIVILFAVNFYINKAERA